MIIYSKMLVWGTSYPTFHRRTTTTIAKASVRNLDSVRRMNRFTNKSAVYLPCRDLEEREAANDVPSQPFMNLLGENGEEVDDHNEGEDAVEYGLVIDLAGQVGANLEEGQEKIYFVIDHGKET